MGMSTWGPTLGTVTSRSCPSPLLVSAEQHPAPLTTSLQGGGQQNLRHPPGNPSSIFRGWEEVYKKNQAPCPAGFWLLLVFVH